MAYASDRNAHDVGASQQVQDDFDIAAGNLEAALGRRQQDVDTAMADYQADGVSDEYAAMEKQWRDAGDEVKAIIKLLRESLAQNDDIAVATLTRAKSYLP
ncbi:pore-forming ESAT-6 family protein [Micropruina sp.]|uniref:pore-forming ESAT-6 family protein n=1 Tax=Micropruina sp. TaxID=2737536 RepID=UPI0039E28A25